MTRSSIHEAIVLQVRAYGESNREASFLTADGGIIQATVYGGAKSKLRAYVAPFHRGRLYLYTDPPKKSCKVTDFDVQSWHPQLRELYERSQAASAILETVLASHGGGGDWENALILTDTYLEALETATERSVPLVLLAFLWKWTRLIGERPSLSECTACACGLERDAVVWYDRRETTVLCPRCARTLSRGHGNEVEMDGNSYFPLGAGTRRYLEAVDSFDARSSLRTSLDEASFREAKRLVTEVLSATIGRKLLLWDTF